MRVGVFVDAGYVYAQGSCAITGLKTPKPRDQIRLSETVVVELLKLQAGSRSGGKELLRIYWYDGAPSTGPSLDQTRLARLDDVKLRLGQLNSEGQQKGVDSLVVTDLMELARNKAISDAVVVTGDEDIRVGVQIAQSHGVRVHLLGISGPPSRGTQSESLRQEADTVAIWDKADVRSFLNILEDRVQSKSKSHVVQEHQPLLAKPEETGPQNGGGSITKAVEHTFSQFEADSKLLASISKHVKAGKEVPGHAVSRLKIELERSLGRKPTKTENKIARVELSKKLREVA